MINVAVFGAGRIGKIHAANLVLQPGVKLKYISDVNVQAARELAGKNGAQVVDIDIALADPAVGAVLIASSTDTHADLILRAVAAGKAIFCEKPVDLALARAKECALAVGAANVTCMMGFQRRFDPTFEALKMRLVAGEIGEPEMLIVTSRDPGAPPVSYLKSSGGIFKDMLIHDFDIFRWILDDEAVSISATGSCLSDPAIAESGDIDSAVVTIRTRRGRLCQINTSRRAAYGYDQRFEVLGSKGMLQAGNHKPTEVVASTAQNVSQDKPEHFFLERYRAAYAREIAHFFDVLVNGGAVRTTIDDGVAALALAEAATLSWRENRTIELSQ
ncbi:inositol 2-dehydrogenase [Glaciimonas immobilis]|uniref:Myo-inositol 2-dehydrogenase/D-chiro-inositol 1-dehydrogenase n=1 Tax=Glaciimonas immobilis TaxID=728004 RepID=A0A840RNN9_9BURK|nr:inositol 2-dehydrogenase [Glaciimonas immobilis]KAF3998866.1 inositol 2-dehydrogenase [Glaciimonas immobilis]MBB5198261.1 myo-inositol 2-dehydrogenase/D-chiro-inositol 1-dehydrogenase [Glaciimonas immobilis]